MKYTIYSIMNGALCLTIGPLLIDKGVETVNLLTFVSGFMFIAIGTHALFSMMFFSTGNIHKLTNKEDE